VPAGAPFFVWVREQIGGVVVVIVRLILTGRIIHEKKWMQRIC
jgi:hypothetical protein